MKKLSLVTAAWLLCTSLASCGAIAPGKVYSASEDMYFDTTSESYNIEYGLHYAGSSMDILESSVADDSNVEVLREEKLVYTANVTLESEDFDTAADALHQKISALGGIIVSENAYNLNGKGYGTRSMDMTVRIPQESYDAFLGGLSDICNIASVNRYVENLTERYYDNENRLKSYRIQEERLFAMLEKTESVSEMLEIESRLCDVQYQIESLTNTQRSIDNDVRYATFNLTLAEVKKLTTPEPETFGDRLTEVIGDSAENFSSFAENLLFVLVYALPYLLCIAIAIVVILVIVKLSQKKNREK